MLTDEVAPGCPIVTQAFGCTSFAGEWAVSGAVCASGWFHRGVDLAGANCCNTPLLAAGSGSVEAVGQTFTGSGGLGPGAILLRLDDGMLAVYGHGYAEVGVGQRVEKGQRIGRVGTQGFSTGCHLHLEICSQLGTVPGGCVNPLGYNGPGGPRELFTVGQYEDLAQKLDWAAHQNDTIWNRLGEMQAQIGEMQSRIEWSIHQSDTIWDFLHQGSGRSAEAPNDE